MFEILLPRLSQQQQLFNTLTLLYEIIKSYKWKTNKDKLPINDLLIHQLFPAMYNIVQQILQQPEILNNTQQPACQITKLIVRIFYDLITCELPVFMRENAFLTSWTQVMLAIINVQVPSTGDIENDEKQPMMKTKKWAYRTLNKLFTR